jgi:hypothetical protein
MDVTIEQRVLYRPREAEVQREMQRIIKKIVKEAHAYRHRDEVEQWVDDNYRSGNQFALGETTAFWWLVQMGIERFRGRH